MQRLCGIDLVRGHDPWTEAPGLVEVLALRDVQSAVAQPVPHAAFVTQRKTSDHGERRLAGDMAALLADHQHDLALVIEFVRYLRPHDRLVGSDQRTRKAAKQVGIFRCLPGVLVLAASVGIVDDDADVFFRGEYRRQHLDVPDLMVGPAGGCRARLCKCLCAKDIEQGRILAELAAKIDDPAVGHRAIAGAVAGFEACKFHDCLRPLYGPSLPLVIAGLDPEIHQSSLRRRWMRGSSPRMTSTSHIHAACGAPGWRSGCARAKASCCMQVSTMRRTVGNGARSTL